MSGGSLDYFYSKIDEPVQIISEKIKWGKKKWSLKTLRKFKMAIKYLKIAQIYTKRIEWLLSGDDGEDSFHERLREELDVGADFNDGLKQKALSDSKRHESLDIGESFGS